MPQLPVDFAAIGADFYVWTGHKAYGPTGIGVLHGKRETARRRCGPWLGGGDMIKVVSFGRFDLERPALEVRGRHQRPSPRPSASAPRSTSSTGRRHREHSRPRARADRIRAATHVRDRPASRSSAPPPSKRGGVISFTLDGMHPHDIGELLGREDVCVRTGHHCAQPLMRKLGVPATARASLRLLQRHRRRRRADRRAHEARKSVRSMMDELYRDYILEHYKSPHHFGELEKHDLQAHDVNPLCGDELGVQLKVDENGTITDLAFHGKGCAISQASASIARDELIGMKVDDVAKLDARLDDRICWGSRSPRRAASARSSI